MNTSAVVRTGWTRTPNCLITGRNPVTMTGSPGAAPVFVREQWPVPHRSLRCRFCTLWPEAAIPDRDPLHHETGNRSPSRAEAPPVHGAGHRGQHRGHPANGRTVIAMRRQQDRHNRIAAIGKKRGKPPRIPRIVPAANTLTVSAKTKASTWWVKTKPDPVHGHVFGDEMT